MNGIDKDTLEELRIIAIGNIQKYQVETRRWRDRKVKVRTIEPRNLVHRRMVNPEVVGKLKSIWEGPYLVKSTNRPRAFRLQDMEGNEMPRSWNINDLRRYYP